MKKNLYLILFAILIVSLNANSIFSFNGYPIKRDNLDSYGLGIGETGVSDLFRINASQENPSTTTTVDNLIFSTAISFGYINYKSEDNKFNGDFFNTPFFNIAVPVKKHRFGFNFTSLANGNLKIVKEASYDSELLDEELTYEEKNWIKSSIYRVGLNYALKNNLLNFGFGVDYYFGNRIFHYDAYYDAVEGQNIYDTRYEISKNFKEPGFSFGLNKKLDNVAFGFAFHSPVDIEMNSEYKYEINSYPTGNISRKLDNITYKLPTKLSFGATYKINQNWKTTAETNYELWRESDINRNPENSYKLALGLAYDPVWGLGKWWQSIPFRFGGYIKKLSFEVNENPVNENALTFGLSVPFASSHKYLDFSVKYLIRGNLDNNSYQDKSLQFSIGTSGFDILRKRRKRTEPREIPKAD